MGSASAATDAAAAERPAFLQFRIPIETEADLRAFVLNAWGVRIPDVKVCKHHTTPWRAFADAYFAKDPAAVWWASRNFGGKSFLMATLAATEAATLRCRVNVLGGSGGQSKNVLEALDALWDAPGAPRHLLRRRAAAITRLRNRAIIRALMASQTSVRGPHPARLRLDEIDEMKLKILDAALGQPADKPAELDGEGVETFPRVPMHTVMSSTYHNPAGTMAEALRRAEPSGTPVYQWCWRESAEPHGWLALSQVERTRRLVTAAMFRNEYDLQEPAPGSRAIDSDSVARMFDERLGIAASGPLGERFEFESPIAGAAYAHGADWARTSDWTIVVTIRTDCRPMRVVSYERTGRLSWPKMVSVLERRIDRYGRGRGLGNALARHDRTGLGDVIDQYLTRPAEGIWLAGRERFEILSEYINAIEKGEIVSPMIRWMHSEHRSASVQDVYGKARGGTDKDHLPDTICAMALAYSCVHRRAIPRVS